MANQQMQNLAAEVANSEKVKSFSQSVARVKKELSKDVVGQKDIIDNVLIAIVAGGNVLLEGVPGVGKTRLVRSLGKTLGLPFSRIQFTPDLMPSDVTGTNVIEKGADGKMSQVFQKGPIFANLVLADEINRATPKTQSAMLEVMQEHKITVAKQTYALSEPFFVLATENPIEQDGTYPLPEAQMDRFMFKLIVKFPARSELMDIVNMTQVTLDETAEAVIDGATVLEMRKLAKAVPVINDVLMYAVNLVSYSHPELDNPAETAAKYIKYGASPRAAQALITAAKVRALMNGNYNVSYEDIDALACPVLRHRIKVTYAAINEKLSVDDVIEMLLKETKKLSKGGAKESKADEKIIEEIEEAVEEEEQKPVLSKKELKKLAAEQKKAEKAKKKEKAVEIQPEEQAPVNAAAEEAPAEAEAQEAPEAQTKADEE